MLARRVTKVRKNKDNWSAWSALRVPENIIKRILHPLVGSNRRIYVVAGGGVDGLGTGARWAGGGWQALRNQAELDSWSDGRCAAGHD